jgi:hypothetical protein
VILIIHVCLASFELPKLLPQFSLSLHFAYKHHKIAKDFGCSNFFAFKNCITAWISKLVGFLITLLNLE